MSRDCLKSFIPYDRDLGNSCWIDSLFVALFHTNKPYIQNFINNLKIKKHDYQFYTKRLNSAGKIVYLINTIDKTIQDQLEVYERSIINLITDVHMTINDNSYSSALKKQKCYNIRNLLQSHKDLLTQAGIMLWYDDFTGQNSSIQLLNYLEKYILHNECFDDIVCHETVFEELKVDYLKPENEFKNIVFYNITYQKNEFNIYHNNIKDSINYNLYLNSIIVHDGGHYMCYYKCDDKWYFYNDLGIFGQSNRTKLIGSGSLNDVIQYHIKNFIKIGDYYDDSDGDGDGDGDGERIPRFEFTLLYLKNDEQAASYQQTASYQQAASYQQTASYQQPIKNKITEEEKEREEEELLKIIEEIREKEIKKEKERKELLKIVEESYESKNRKLIEQIIRDDLERNNEISKQLQVAEFQYVGPISQKDLDRKKQELLKITKTIQKNDIKKEKETQELLKIAKTIRNDDRKQLQAVRQKERERQIEIERQIERERARSREIKRQREKEIKQQENNQRKIEINEEIELLTKKKRKMEKKVRPQLLKEAETENFKKLLEENFELRFREFDQKLIKLKEELEILEFEQLELNMMQ